MMARTNFRGKAPETHRDKNFEKRLKETMNSELESELVTPMSAGVEDLPSYRRNFPLVEQFEQQNMSTPPTRPKGSQSGRGRDAD